MAAAEQVENWLSSRGFRTFPFHDGRVRYVALPAMPPTSVAANAYFFSIDSDLVYWNFFLDFGPLNLGQLYRFCAKLNAALASPKLRGRTIYFYSGTHPHRRTNAAALLSSWAIIFLNQTPEEAYAPFRGATPGFTPFHDATPIACSYNLTVYDCLCGLYKAKNLKFFDFDTFNVDEYEHYEQVENGDLNWHQEGKWLAFAGPHENSEMTRDGYQTLTVDDYGPYFQQKGVTLVVRLNKKYYDERKFLKYGIRVLDLYYLDGSNPPRAILDQFLREVEGNAGGIAVHCKAGLGRTGTCIGCYLMKHFKFTAAEVIGWFRICRPGTIIGPQQHYMAEMEQVMWREGDLYRQRKANEDKEDARPGDKEVVEGMLGSLETLALGAKATAPEAKRSKRHSAKQAADVESSTAAEEAAEEEGKTTQGDELRAMRARNMHGGGGGGMGIRRK